MSFQFNSQQLELTGIVSRTRLYRLEPIGIGTPDVESLTSYVARLAAAHSLTVRALFRYEIARNEDGIQSNIHPTQLQSVANVRLINSGGSVSNNWIKRLECLVGRDNLRFLTFITWSQVFPTKNLFHSNLNWCPACLATDDLVYYRLRWQLKPISICTIHESPLQSICPSCRYSIPFLSSLHRIGFCPRCRQSLTNPSAYPSSPLPNLPLEKAVSGQIGELLAQSHKMITVPEKNAVSKAFRICEMQLGIKSVNDLAKRINTNRITTWHWRAGKTRPQLDRLIHVCNTLGISAFDFLTCDVQGPQRSFPTCQDNFDQQRKTASQPKVLDLENIRDRLNDALQSHQKPKSLRAIARDLKIHTQILYEHFPELCRKISDRYKDMLRLRVKFRQSLLRQEIRSAVAAVYAFGERPNTCRVARRLQKPGSIRDPIARATFDEMMAKELE